MSAATARWAYDTGAKRDLRIDFLRGAAMVGMIVDHTGGDSSWLYVLTGGNRFFVSAAEAFFFMSGFVTGVVYSGLTARESVGVAVMKMLRRAVVLYVLAVFLGVGLPLLASWLGLPWEQPFGQGSALDVIVSILTLHRTYYLADIILTYALLFPCAALAIVLVSEGYTSVVLAVSWAVWLGWQLWPQFSQVPWDIQTDTVFNFSAWQVLFFNALVIGAHRRAFASQLARIPRWLYGVGSALLFAGCIALYRSQLAVFKAVLPRVSTQQLANVLFSKPDVRFGRLIVFAITATLAFTLVTQLWKPLFSLLGWLFVPLGQQSLSAYTFHLAVVAFIAGGAPLILGSGPYSAGQNAVLQLTAVTVVWAAVSVQPRLAHLAHLLDQAEHRLLDEAHAVLLEMPLMSQGP